MVISISFTDAHSWAPCGAQAAAIAFVDTTALESMKQLLLSYTKRAVAASCGGGTKMDDDRMMVMKKRIMMDR